jgi:hypothetical protein
VLQREGRGIIIIIITAQRKKSRSTEKIAHATVSIGSHLMMKFGSVDDKWQAMEDIKEISF